MKKTLAILFGVVIAVAGLRVIGETQPSGWLSILANDSQAAVQFRALSSYGAPVTIGHGTAAPTAANTGAPPMDGELYVTRTAGADPALAFYSQNDATWYTVFHDDTATVTANWTFSGTVTITGDTTISGDLNIDGPITTTVYRDEFSRPCMLREEDYTDEAVGDAAMNIAHCLDGVATQYHYRLDGAQASPFIQEVSLGNAAGGPYMIDMDSDAANGEGVQVVFTNDPQVPVLGGFLFGQTARFRIGVYVVDISDTSVLHMGFRLNEDYIDNYVLVTMTDYTSFSSPAGVTSATSAFNDTDRTDLIAACDIEDTTEAVFEIQISAAGVPTFLCGLTEATLVEVAAATAGVFSFEAGDVFVPYIAVLNGASAGGEYHMTFIEIEYTDE